MKRNEFIKTSLTLGAGFSLLGCANEQPSTQSIDHNWNSGDVAHILPTVNHNRMLISASFKRAVKKPVLKVGQKSVGGTMRDSEGEFWIFDCTDLEPNSTYDLRLYEGSSPLCDTWPLKTFPLPSTDVSQLKLMIYTCAGGHPISRDYRPLLKETKEQFITRRISLLKRQKSNSSPEESHF